MIMGRRVFFVGTCTFLWMNQTILADLFWNELTHLETMTPNAKTQKGWRHWCCLNLVLFKPWLRWFRVLGFFAPIFEKLINPIWQYVQIKRTIQPRTSEGWRIHRRSRLFFRGSGSSFSKLNRIYQSLFLTKFLLICSENYKRWLVLE